MRLLYRDIHIDDKKDECNSFSIYSTTKYLFVISHPNREFSGVYNRLFILKQTEMYNDVSVWDDAKIDKLAEALYSNQCYKIFDTGFLKDNSLKYMGHVNNVLYFAHARNRLLEIKQYIDGCPDEDIPAKMVHLLYIIKTERFNENTVWTQRLFEQFLSMYIKKTGGLPQRTN